MTNSSEVHKKWFSFYHRIQCIISYRNLKITFIYKKFYLIHSLEPRESFRYFDDLFTREVKIGAQNRSFVVRASGHNLVNFLQNTEFNKYYENFSTLICVIVRNISALSNHVRHIAPRSSSAGHSSNRSITAIDLVNNDHFNSKYLKSCT